MRKINFKKLIRYISVLPVLFVFITGTTARAVSGGCGEKASYTLENGILTIEGSGAMRDFRYPEDTPWFEDRATISKVVVKNGITHIGDMAFYDCDNLHTAEIPSTVQTIGDYAFSNCEKLTIAALPANLTEIGGYAFERCSSLPLVQIPSKTKIIGSGAFYRCSSLTTITIPRSVESIGSSAFAYCKGIISADVQCVLNEVPVWLFYGCEALESISFASQVDSVGDYAIYGCANLDSITCAGEQQVLSEFISIPETIPAPDLPSAGGVAGETPTGQITPVRTPVPTPEPEKEVHNTDGALIIVTKPEKENQPPEKYEIIIQADSGVQDAVNLMEEEIEKTEALPSLIKIQLMNSNTLSGSVLQKIAGQKTTLEVTTAQNHIWVFKGNQLNGDNFKDLDLSVTLEPKTGMTATEKSAYGSTGVYTLKFNGKFIYNAEVRVKLGADFSRKYATLFFTNGENRDSLQNVLIDSESRASFAFGAGSVTEGYVVAVDVASMSVGQEAYIPENMQGEYTGLMDENGTRYVVTGVESSWGIGIGEFTRYVVVGFVGIVIVVGCIVYVLMKQEEIKRKYKQD